MIRPKVDMDYETFKKCLYWAKYFVAKYGQSELNLAGIGESTMHPDFIEYVALAKQAVGANCKLVLATNGLLITDEMAKAIAPFDPWIWVSLHRPEKAGPAVEILKKYNLLAGVSNDASIAAMNWAGQVNWHVSVKKRQCFWVKGGKVMAMADGNITQCCIDGSGVGVMGHILQDDLNELSCKPYSLCHTCDQDVGMPLLKETL